MSDFKTVRGFEEVWRPAARTHFKLTPATLRISASHGEDTRARLERIVARAPEVLVKVTGRSANHTRLLAHLSYVTRDGRLEMEDRDGNTLTGREAVKELAGDWTAAAMSDSRRRIDSPVSLSLVLAMPPPTDPAIVKDAARSFARRQFSDQFDYVFVLHTDVDHPHVHLAVQAGGERGLRLDPRKADLEIWRQEFAQTLRDRGVNAEATQRSTRGITRKSEHPLLRRIRERHEAGLGEPARNIRAAYFEAAKAAFQNQTEPTIFERQLFERQVQIRALYLAQAKLLQEARDPADQKLGRAVEDFVRSMPEPDSRRLAFARELRATNERLRSRESQRPARDFPLAPERDR